MNILFKNEKDFYKKTLKYILPYKYKVLIIYISTIISNVLSLLPIYFMGEIIDHIINKDINSVKVVIIKIIIVYIVNMVFSLFETYYSNITTNRLTRDIKNDIFELSINLPMHELDHINSGEILATLEGDVNKIVQFFISDLLNMFVSLITLIISLIFILKMSTKLSLIALTTFPIISFANILFGKKLKNYSLKIREIMDNYFKFFTESFDRIKQIKCMNLEEHTYKEYKSINEEYSEKNIKSSVISMFSSLFTMTITSISEWIIIFVASIMIINSTLSIGAFVSFNGYLSKFMMAMGELLNMNINLQVTSVSLNRIYNILETPKENLNNKEIGLNLDGRIILSKVKFSYKEDEDLILNDLDVCFNPNSISVIVGKNGSGKTTLLDLLVGLYTVDSGSIMFGNYNQKDINLKDLRNNISYIHQNPMIFNTTIIENFKYVNKNISIEEVKRLCSLVDLHQYIESMPDNYNTILGPGGIKLSGGENQRLAIAIALAKGSKILLLDEITSNLDVVSEFKIIEVLEGIKDICTIIMISHRPTSIKKIPNIYVLHNGKIVSSGNHEYLIKNSVEYVNIFGSLEKMT